MRQLARSGSGPSLVAIANQHVPFPQAVRWAGIRMGEARDRGTKVRCPFGELYHPDEGREPAMRVYYDHGWCFAEQRYLTSVTLLAVTWGLSKEDAAAKALERSGYVPEDYSSVWEEALREPEPDREALAAALVTWCSGHDPQWPDRQYDAVVSAMLGGCQGLLSAVRTEEECQAWLAGSKQVMEITLGHSSV